MRGVNPRTVREKIVQFSGSFLCQKPGVHAFAHPNTWTEFSHRVLGLTLYYRPSLDFRVFYAIFSQIPSVETSSPVSPHGLYNHTTMGYTGEQKEEYDYAQ
jgi:hypothetical protein